MTSFDSMLFFCDHYTVLLPADLLPVEASCLDSLPGSLVQILDFLLGLFKRQADLLLGQLHQVTIDAFQDIIHIAARQLDVILKGLLVGFRIDMRLLQKNKVHTLLI